MKLPIRSTVYYIVIGHEDDYNYDGDRVFFVKYLISSYLNFIPRSKIFFLDDNNK